MITITTKSNNNSKSNNKKKKSNNNNNNNNNKHTFYPRFKAYNAPQFTYFTMELYFNNKDNSK